MKLIILISILTLTLDILSKYLVLNNLSLYQSITVIESFFYITYTKNTGIAFSFLEGHIPLIIFITSIIILLIIKYIKNNVTNKLEIICYSMLIGGAIGNLRDRILYGYVIDFLEFNLFNINFPIFNIADIAIVVGTTGIIILSYIESRNKDGNNSSRKIKNR